jgi:hypothetical protein
VERRWFTRTTQKPSNSRLNGRAHHNSTPEEGKIIPLKCEQHAVFTTFKELCIMNVFPRVQTVNQHENTDLKRGIQGDWFHNHENAPAHSALSVSVFLAKNMILFPHPPQSPDFFPQNSQ